MHIQFRPHSQTFLPCSFEFWPHFQTFSPSSFEFLHAISDQKVAWVLGIEFTVRTKSQIELWCDNYSTVALAAMELVTQEGSCYYPTMSNDEFLEDKPQVHKGHEIQSLQVISGQ